MPIPRKEEEIAEEPIIVPNSSATVLGKEPASNVIDTNAQVVGIVVDEKGPEGSTAETFEETTVQTSSTVAPGEETATTDTETQVG